VMRLLVDISRVTFTVTKAPAEKCDQNGVQKKDRTTGEPLFTTQVMALDETGGDMLTITTAGAPPKVSVGQQVHPVELEAIPWATNGRNGVAYRASSLTPTAVTTTANAAA
jgi:hypothetical protein